MAHSNHICKNCESLFNENFDFCPHCGQKRNDDLTLKVLFYNTISNYFSFDARFFKSFLPLLLKPGYLAKQFVLGKRLLYLHPAQMYLFIAIVFFFLNSFKVTNWTEKLDANLTKGFEKDVIYDSTTGDSIKDAMNLEKRLTKLKLDSVDRVEVRKALKNNQFITGMTDKEIDSIVQDKDFRAVEFSLGPIEKTLDSLIALDAPEEVIYKEMGRPDDAGTIKTRIYKQGLKFYKLKKAGGLFQTFFDTIPIAMFFVLPIFALILFLFYRKSGSYTHHLIFSFYYFSYLFTVFSLIIIVNFMVDIPDWIDWIIILSTFIYLVLAMKRFYNQSMVKSFFKACFTTILFSPVVVITGVVVLIFAFMFY